ncbi:hypothetical protein J2J97_09095 [Rhizobium bangladeshense]|uniref:8-oxoguanine DNA glycosylase OGG fold protein n=1 Tax=Rhizobium bangladeshense TaxID=1138189 RepID=UPI001A97FFAB|nr:hypothetical protein [Rhizobium bangladeshense]QSY96042.1 hypothetical protein J2J97_09095 [Rhizobium bangladeshense]
MTTAFVPKHIEFLKQSYSAPPQFSENEKVGASPRKWFDGFKEPTVGLYPKKLGGRLSRAELLAMAAQEDVETDDLCITILAWGGMRPANRNSLLKCDAARWLKIANRIRSGKIATRHSAFDEFATLRANDGAAMNGMGAAYFTKLIYFLMPRGVGRGLILDQWAGLSVNLLVGSELVKMDETSSWRQVKGDLKRFVSSRVSDVNTADEYEQFCIAIEELGSTLGTVGRQTLRSARSCPAVAPRLGLGENMLWLSVLAHFRSPLLSLTTNGTVMALRRSGERGHDSLLISRPAAQQRVPPLHIA